MSESDTRSDTREPVRPRHTVQWLWAVTAGALAFVATWAAGVAVTILVVLALLPNRAEAYEGFGDGVLALFLAGAGAVVSCFGGVVVGATVYNRAHSPPPR